MTPPSVSLEEALEVLNDALRRDHDAMLALTEHREPCNEELAHHPTIQVVERRPLPGYQVGLLGILNGLFGAAEDGWGYIMARFALTCPTCKAEGKALEGLVEGQPCPACSTPISSSKLLEFARTEH